MDKVSIVIPVYKDGNIVEIVESILKDPYPNKEIIICASSPSESLQKKLKIVEKKGVKVVIYKERKGKVSEVNETVKNLDTDILVFFDADIKIRKIDISKIVEACKKYDLVEFYKDVAPKCFIGKFMHIEFLSYYAFYQYISSKLGKSIFINGGGFAIRKSLWDKLGGYKRVILEDVDLAIRVYSIGGKYFLLRDVELEVQPICSWKKWFDQRKRWCSGAIEVFFTYFKEMISFFVENPLILLFYILVVNPSIVVLFLLLFLLPQSIIYKISLGILILLSSKISPLLLFIVPATLISSIIYNFLFFILTTLFVLISYEVAYYKLTKKLMNPLWVIGYSLFYSLLFFLILITIFIYYLTFERFPHFNWKV